MLLGTGLSVLLVILVLGYSGHVDPEPVVVHHRYRRSGDGKFPLETYLVILSFQDL